MAYSSYVLIATVLLLSVGCTVPLELDNNPCLSPVVQKDVRNCFTALVETSRQVSRDGVDGRTAYCCRLQVLKICLTSVLDRYGCQSESNPDQQLLNLISEALYQSPCKADDVTSCQPYLQPFQKVSSDLHSDPYHKSHREPRSSNSTELTTDKNTSIVNDDIKFIEFHAVEDMKFNNLTANDSLEAFLDSQDMFDVDWQVLRRIIVVVSDKSKKRVFLFKLSQEYDGSFKTVNLPVDEESLPKLMKWSSSSKMLMIDPKAHNSTSIVVSKSNEEATVLLADYVEGADLHNFSDTNSSLEEVRQARSFKWANFFNSTNIKMKDFMKDMNASFYKILSSFRESSALKSLNLTDGNSNESETDFFFVIPVETDNWLEDEIGDQEENTAENSTNALQNRTEHGRAVITIATMPPFEEDESMSVITESPDPVVMFFGIWPPENRQSRNLEFLDHHNDTRNISHQETRLTNESSITNSSKTVGFENESNL